MLSGIAVIDNVIGVMTAAINTNCGNWKFDLNKADEQIKEVHLRPENKQFQNIAPTAHQKIRRVRSKGIY